MAFTTEQLNHIYDRTTCYCHLCHREEYFANYGRLGARGAWEVEHSNPRASGRTNRLLNLYPACIPCNRSKGAGTTRAFRAEQGKSRAPMSAAKRKEAKAETVILGGVAGAAAG